MPNRKPSPKNKSTSVPDEQTFRLMFEGHSAVMLLVDPHTGAIIDANKAAANFYRYPKSKLCGMPIQEINVLPPEQVAVEYQKALNEERNYFIFTHRLASGEERIVEIYSSPIALREKQALFFIIHDITERRQAEEILQEQKDLLNSIMESASDAIFAKDAAGHYLIINTAGANMLGLSVSEVIGRTDMDIIPAETAREFRKTDEKVMSSGRSYEREEAGVINGKPRVFLASKMPFRNKSGEIVGVIGISEDITERKRVDEELRKSEERYRTLFNNMMDGIYRSTHAGKFVDVNPAMVKMFGYSSREEMLEVDIKKDLYFSPEERGSHILDTGREETEVYRMRRKDGTEIWVEDHGHYVHDEQGNILYHEGMLRDVTARKQADEIIRESEERLTAVVEGGQLGYSDWNIQTGEIRRNERWAGMLGYTLKEIETTYQQWEDLLHPDDRASALQAIQDHLNGKTPIHRDEYRLRAKDGSYCWILDQGKIIECDLQGRPLRMTATHTDITARRQAEAELRQAKEALEVTHRELEQAFAREQQLARIDTLTGVNNRRYLFELAGREFNIAIRYGSPLSVLMFDIDDFKLINDGFGHAIGDQALQYITRVVETQLRSVDVIGRYGGDEFIILLPQTNAQEARFLGERIHASIAAMRMETNKGPLTLTISLGIAQTIHRELEPDSVEGLLLRADQALYAAKQAGRNRTVIFDAR